MNVLKDKIVLLTGATGGLGSEFAKQLIEMGAFLVLTEARQEKLDTFMHSLSQNEQKKILGTCKADLSQTSGAETVFEQTRKISVNIDVLINNAGVAHAGEFANIPGEKWEMSMQINLLSPMRLCHLFLPGMKERGQGHIVNVSSVAGIVALPGGAPYTASKHGLLGFSNAIRLEYEKYGIKVSTVHPFFTKTPILDSERFDKTMSDKQVPEFLQEKPHDVVREILNGICEKQEMILPGLAAKTLDITRRYFPGILRYLHKLT